MIRDEQTIGYLNYLVKEYDGIKKLIVATKQRLQALNPDAEEQHDPILYGEIVSDAGGVTKYQGLESIKNSISRKIKKELSVWPIWDRWMSKVPGIGPYIGGSLILLYYYKFIPVCMKCGTALIKKDNTFFCEQCQKSVKGDGLSKYRIDIKDFSKISSWWHYMGRHIVDSKMPKRKSGEVSDWSSFGRMIGFQIGDQFNRNNNGHLYKAFLEKQKEKHARKNTEREKDWTKGHIHNAAKNEAAKLFLSHFWQIARELDGLPVTEPYVSSIMGHDNIIKPYYWKD